MGQLHIMKIAGYERFLRRKIGLSPIKPMAARIKFTQGEILNTGSTLRSASPATRITTTNTTYIKMDLRFIWGFTGRGLDVVSPRLLRDDP